jgi:hypothetical protein
VHDSPLARVASDHLPVKALVNLKRVEKPAADHLQINGRSSP